MNTNQLIENLPGSEYHLPIKGISRSGLSLMDVPKKYWYKYLSGEAEREETKALRIGGAFHTLTLEPHKFTDSCIIVPEDAPKRPSITQRNAKKPSADTVAQILWWDEFNAKCDGKTVIKSDEIAVMKAMAQSVLSEPASRKVINADGIIEPSFFWFDEEFEIDAKCRPDYYRKDGIVVDLKTCADAGEEAFQRSVMNYDYDLQAFMQIEGIHKVTGDRPTDFIFVCIEKEAPYCAAFYTATPELIACGEAKYRRLMKIYAACKKADKWPGYGSFIRPLNMPEWYVSKHVRVEEVS
jgi:hypothetical protein